MSKTLKEKYQQKRIVEVQNKLKNIDAKIIESNKNYQMAVLLEAFDEKQAQEIIKTLEQLNKLNFGSLKKLDDAKKAAIADLKTIMGGGGKSKMLTVANMFKKVVGGAPIEDNPLVTSMSFVNGIKSFFNLFTPFIQKLEGASKDKTIINVITKTEGNATEGQDVKTLKNNLKNEEYPNADQKEALTAIDQIEKIILQGLSPDDPISKMGRNWVKNYLGDKAGMIELANQLINSKISDIETITADINTAFPNIDSAGQAAAEAAQQAEKGNLPGGQSSEGGKPEELTPQQQKVQLVAVQNAAKDAGIKEEETVTRFLDNVMGWKEGIKHPYSDTAIQVLKSYAFNKAKIAKGQLDGFVDGITIDQNKVKQEIQALVDKAEAEKKKKEAEAAAKGGGSQAAAAGQGAAVGG